MWRGAYVWDPAVILAQIVALQAAFYALLGALLAVLVGAWLRVYVCVCVVVSGRREIGTESVAPPASANRKTDATHPPTPQPGPYAGDGGVTLAHVFSSSKLDFGSFAGWMAVVANAAAALGAAVAVAALVERAKKCLDFATTLYGIHLVLCCVIGGFPRTAAWWIVNAAGCAGAAAGSEWVCLQRELADIPLGAALRRAAAAAAAGVAGAAGGKDGGGAGVELTGSRGGGGGAGAGSTRSQGGLPV